MLHLRDSYSAAVTVLAAVQKISGFCPMRHGAVSLKPIAPLPGGPKLSFQAHLQRPSAFELV